MILGFSTTSEPNVRDLFAGSRYFESCIPFEHTKIQMDPTNKLWGIGLYISFLLLGEGLKGLALRSAQHWRRQMRNDWRVQYQYLCVELGWEYSRDHIADRDHSD